MSAAAARTHSFRTSAPPCHCTSRGTRRASWGNTCSFPPVRRHRPTHIPPGTAWAWLSLLGDGFPLWVPLHSRARVGLGAGGVGCLVGQLALSTHTLANSTHRARPQWGSSHHPLTKHVRSAPNPTRRAYYTWNLQLIRARSQARAPPPERPCVPLLRGLSELSPPSYNTPCFPQVCAARLTEPVALRLFTPALPLLRFSAPAAST